MEDYKIEQLANLTQQVGLTLNNVKEKIWDMRYHSLHAIFVYFEYAVSCVHIQEENLKLMENGEHNNFSSHEEYAESEIRIYAGAVSAYDHLRIILNFSKGLIEDSLKDSSFEEFRNKNLSWVKDLIDKRDRIGAHPENINFLISKRQGRSSDGRVFYQSRDLEHLTPGPKFTLTPRKDLEQVRTYLNQLSIYLKNSWFQDLK